MLISTSTCRAEPSSDPIRRAQDGWPALPIHSSRSTGVRTPDPEYDGWYVTGTWFFGGHKNYNKEGKWDRPTIDNPLRWNEGRGWGAVELVGKYDVLDMSDKRLQRRRQVRLPDNPALSQLGSTGEWRLHPSAHRASALCGEQRTWIVGVNWYLNDYVRLMFDYAEADLSGYPLTAVTQRTSLAPGTCHNAGFDGRHCQRLRHARASRLVKLEKRNFSPLRCQTAALKRGGGFFCARRSPAPFASSCHAWRDSNSPAQKPSCRLTVTSRVIPSK